MPGQHPNRASRTRATTRECRVQFWTQIQIGTCQTREKQYTSSKLPIQRKKVDSTRIQARTSKAATISERCRIHVLPNCGYDAIRGDPPIRDLGWYEASYVDRQRLNGFRRKESFHTSCGCRKSNLKPMPLPMRSKRDRDKESFRRMLRRRGAGSVAGRPPTPISGCTSQKKRCARGQGPDSMQKLDQRFETEFRGRYFFPSFFFC